MTLLVKFYYPLKKLLDIKSPFGGYIKLERIRRIRTEREKQDTMKPSYKTRKSLRLSVISFILIILLLSLTSLPAFAQDEHTGGRILYAGGIPFGVKFFSRGVIISGFCDIPVSGGENRNPAVTAGLKLNDIIISVNGKEPGRKLAENNLYQGRRDLFHKSGSRLLEGRGKIQMRNVYTAGRRGYRHRYLY